MILFSGPFNFPSKGDAIDKVKMLIHCVSQEAKTESTWVNAEEGEAPSPH